jgi:hypothetical protein
MGVKAGMPGEAGVEGEAEEEVVEAVILRRRFRPSLRRASWLAFLRA